MKMKESTKAIILVSLIGSVIMTVSTVVQEWRIRKIADDICKQDLDEIIEDESEEDEG